MLLAQMLWLEGIDFLVITMIDWGQFFHLTIGVRVKVFRSGLKGIIAL